VFRGRVAAVQGILIEIKGIQGYLSIGDRCSIAGRGTAQSCVKSLDLGMIVRLRRLLRHLKVLGLVAQS
jgi:hypothetical protein